LGAELGHVVVDADGPECPGACPNHGCLEALCSGTALEREASAAAGRRVKGREVVERAREGDGDAVGLLATLGRWLGVGISNFVNVFEPSHVVIGGGLSAAADLILPSAESEFRARALPALAAHAQLAVAKAGNDAGVIGAGLLAAQELGLSGDTPGSPPREEVG
jgi:glucokinase